MGKYFEKNYIRLFEVQVDKICEFLVNLSPCIRDMSTLTKYVQTSEHN